MYMRSWLTRPDPRFEKSIAHGTRYLRDCPDWEVVLALLYAAVISAWPHQHDALHMPRPQNWSECARWGGLVLLLPKVSIDTTYRKGDLQGSICVALTLSSVGVFASYQLAQFIHQNVHLDDDFVLSLFSVSSQPPQKRINYTTITNTAGNSVLVVGVVLSEGASGAAPTVLLFTVNVPKTGFYNFVLRYKVR